jgi:exosortase A-associated hydrolase 2
MTETPFLFPNGRYSLFGVLHSPAAVSGMPAFVFCHPFGEEKLWTHRVFVSFARQLARRGHPVLRFDYMGNGDSEGHFGETSLTSIQSDVRCAMAQVKELTGATKLNLLGLRFGAMVASLVAESATDVERLILWAPIVNGGAYMQELLRINLSTQLATNKQIVHDREALVAQMERGATVNVDGYDLSLPLYSEISAVKLAAAPKACAAPCLVAQVDRQERPAPDLRQLAATYVNSTVTFAQEEPFWKEIQRWYADAPNLAGATETWLQA